ncbi:MAG TPA: YciI family protein [Gemmatimonadota bacterium]|nr:YciI family protein [Gemmatimonadota bacterium]
MIEDSKDGGMRVDWSAAEHAALEHLRHVLPPPDLEDSVVAALGDRGFVVSAAAVSGSAGQERRVPAHRRWGWAGLALAACVAAFYAGLSISERGAGRSDVDAGLPAAVAAPSRYLLLLYEDESYQAPATSAEGEARAAEYSAWAAGVRAESVPIEGEELSPAASARMLDGSGDGIVETDGAPAGTAGILAGYFVIEAPDEDAAIAIARTIPHLTYGGRVVVRAVVQH